MSAVRLSVTQYSAVASSRCRRLSEYVIDGSVGVDAAARRPVVPRRAVRRPVAAGGAASVWSTVSFAVDSKAERISCSASEGSSSSASARGALVATTAASKLRAAAVPGRARHPAVRARAAIGPAREVHRRAEPLEQRPDVRAAAAGDRAPAAPAQAEHRVVREELDPVRRPGSRAPPAGPSTRARTSSARGNATGTTPSNPRRGESGRTTCRPCRPSRRSAGSGGSRAAVAARHATAACSTTRARTRRTWRTTSRMAGSQRRARGRAASAVGSSPRCGR